MKPVVIVLLAALSVSEVWQRATRDTNSHAASKKGVDSYSKQRYTAAEQSFTTANAAAPSSSTAFNLGTAQIAAGHRADGSATLEKSIADPALRVSSLYNRGNSALASKVYDHAIRDYTEVLKIRPGDAQAKRNLEIALMRQKADSDQQAKGGQTEQKGKSPDQKTGSSSEPDKEQSNQQQQSDAESLLRSVQQQEQEEMQRMKRSRAKSVRVGW